MKTTRDLNFPLSVVPRSLKEMVSFLGTDPRRSHRTSMMYWNKTLYFSYDADGVHPGLSVLYQRDERPNKMLYLELTESISFDTIQKQLSMYNFAVTCHSCHIITALKGTMLCITIIPLDDISRKALEVMEKALSSNGF